MNLRGQTRALIALGALVLAGCESAPGRPAAGSAPIPPDEIADFDYLYAASCSGCHGSEGRGGAAMPLNNPVYLAIADDALLLRVASKGIAGTSMAAFAQSAGGRLTDRQVGIIVSGMRARWAKQDALRDANPPPYSAPAPGDSARGAEVYATYCSSCHGAGGRGGPKGSSIVDGSFLALLTDQELRTLVIFGRPDLGAPDWRNNVPGRPMSPQEISDVVAWMSSQRPQFPGQPYPDAGKKAGETR
jgi:mono/diheme cytochrome c family protein